MCLITVGKAVDLRSCLLGTVGLVEDIFGNNRDGFGVMYAGDTGSVVRKTLPKTADEALAWLDLVLPKDDREVAVHARYATHGVINLSDDGDDNTHPYSVDGGYLMHNGILDLDTKSDKARSDTWHFCRNYLDGTAHVLFNSDAGRLLLANHIGNNRFVFLGKDGRMHIVNEDQGVHGKDLWFSNTYAWDPRFVIPTYRKPAKYYGGKWAGVSLYGGMKNWLDDDEFLVETEPGETKTLALAYEEEEVDEYDKMAQWVEQALEEYDEEMLADAFEMFGRKAVEYIMHVFEIAPWRSYDPRAYDDDNNEAAKAWVDGDAATVTAANINVAVQALVHCCDWTMRGYEEAFEEAPALALVQ